jgi:hypothetical protein
VAIANNPQQSENISKSNTMSSSLLLQNNSISGYIKNEQNLKFSFSDPVQEKNQRP